MDGRFAGGRKPSYPTICNDGLVSSGERSTNGLTFLTFGPLWLGPIFHLQISNEEKVNYIERIIRLKHDHRPAAGRGRQPFPMRDCDLATVSQMHHERMERLDIIKLPDFFNRHFQ